MALLSTSTLWANHPYPNSPCNFTNQCAIRMGVALQKSGVNTRSFRGAKCWHGHKPPHILRAQELADWLKTQTSIVGKVKVYKGRGSVSAADFKDKKGIVFIRNGWGATDHIDVWDGSDMKGGNTNYFTLGDQVWFWELPA